MKPEIINYMSVNKTDFQTAEYRVKINTMKKRIKIHEKKVRKSRDYKTKDFHNKQVIFYKNMRRKFENGEKIKIPYF